jgi:GR25 family glycosyltransferase involved in LPS biosynthesis
MKSCGLLLIVVLTILVLHLFRYTDTFIPTTIINLDRSPERMRNMTLQCYAYGIPYQRLPAVDGNSYEFTQAEKDMLFGLALERDKNIKNTHFKHTKEEQAALYETWEKDPKFKRSKRVMSCALSHIRAWRRYQYTTDPYILILEDDGTLDSHFRQHVNDTLKNMNRIDPKWDLIWLSGDNPGDRERVLQWNRHEIYRMDPPDYVGQGTGAYIFSRKGLNRFLNVIETEGCSLASDRFLIAHLDPKHSYGIHPPIVDIHNSSSPSLIGY